MNIGEIIQDSIETKKALLSDQNRAAIQSMGECIINSLKRGNTIYIAGNGGSAADAQHFAAELAGKFETERRGLRAMALTTNTSNITAIANDYSYNKIFSRQLAAFGKERDVFVGISTSGNSQNIIEAAKFAKTKNIISAGLLGRNGGKLKNLCDLAICVPSDSTARIQEAHILIIHIISKMIDDEFSQNNYENQ